MCGSEHVLFATGIAWRSRRWGQLVQCPCGVRSCLSDPVGWMGRNLSVGEEGAPYQPDLRETSPWQTPAKSHSGGMGLVLVSQGCQESHPTALGPRQRERDPAAVGFSGLGCSHVLRAFWQMQCLYKATNDFLKEWSLDNGVLLCSLPKQGGCVTLILSGCGLL